MSDKDSGLHLSIAKKNNERLDRDQWFALLKNVLRPEQIEELMDRQRQILRSLVRAQQILGIVF